MGTTDREAATPRRRHEPQGPRAPGGVMCFEIATEVCNQVGGIYQVLRSKAPAMVERWRTRYYLVGPYDPKRSTLEFEPKRPTGWMKRVVDNLAKQGLIAHHGVWLVSGRPRVLLLERPLSEAQLATLKDEIWQHHGIETPGSDPFVDLSVGFAGDVRLLMREVCKQWVVPGGSGRVLAHFHEWLGGLACPLIRREKLPVATSFTTHATLLGRYIAGNEPDFYDKLPKIEAWGASERYGVRTQHHIERTCAHAAHVLTTVSGITGEECQHLLGRVPDGIVPNGLNVERFDVGHEFQTLHQAYKDKIHRFTMGHFFPSYSFDLSRTIYAFTSGRYEPGNKGFDLCLEALSRLNYLLKDFDLGVTVVFFIVTQRDGAGLSPRALQSRGVLNELQSVCESILKQVGERMFSEAAAGRKVELDALIDDYWALRYRRTQQALRTDGLPPVCTHAVPEPDPVLDRIRQLGLFNRPEDRVKVVYHPEFIRPENPLWGIEYDQFVRGCHLGVFPSAYEPWGYTPLECVAMGVPSITSDLAGFGRYVQERFPDHNRWGMNVLKRRGRPMQDAAADLSRWLLAYCRLDRRGRIDMRNAVERHAHDFGWDRLAGAYHKAHDLALERASYDF
ncbi:MAG: glycogen synthase [Phycisphaerales bacterium]|nr:MAG: glycogen synthase [Phycisphaerales bacterium]